MTLSRLRLRFAAVFGVTLSAALILSALASVAWFENEGVRRIDQRIDVAASELLEAMKREEAETPDSTYAFAMEEVRRDWVRDSERWVVMDSLGNPIAATASKQEVDMARDSARELGNDSVRRWFAGSEDAELRVLMESVGKSGKIPAIKIAMFSATEGAVQDRRRLTWVLALGAPVIVLSSLAGGYLLSRRTLRPVWQLDQALSQIEPTDLSARVPVRSKPDELDLLAIRFNDLLSRVEAAQVRNRVFVREAAHQIRTPLTVIRGEADYALSMQGRSREEFELALQRILSVSQQMQRRVDDLMRLAEAESGATIELGERVELDSLVADVVDTFRTRAAQVGRSLAFGEIDSTTVIGNAGLLSEALLELLENAGRYSRAGSEIRVSLVNDDQHTNLIVENSVASENRQHYSQKIGQRIVRWIVEGHGGRFEAGFRTEHSQGRAQGHTYLARVILLRA